MYWSVCCLCLVACESKPIAPPVAQKPRVVVRFASFGDDYTDQVNPPPLLRLWPGGKLTADHFVLRDLGRVVNAGKKGSPYLLTLDFADEPETSLGDLMGAIERLRKSVAPGHDVTIIIRSKTLKSSVISH